jgi:hypothetical protein
LLSYSYIHFLEFIVVDKPAAEVEMCQLTRLIVRYYRVARKTHESLYTLKTTNIIMYWLIVFIVCLVPVILCVKISGFYESYLTMFTLFLVLQYKLNLQWTAASPSTDESVVMDVNAISDLGKYIPSLCVKETLRILFYVVFLVA